MPRLALALALLPTLAAAAPAPPAAQPAPPPAPRVIRVSGEGHVRVRPDVAVVQAGVELTGKDLQKVSADVSAQTRRLYAALEQAGIAEKDVQTVRHDVQVQRPWKDGQPGPITGYTVADEVRVTVRDLSRLGATLERVVAAGSNVLRGLSFEKEDPTAEQAQALARAVTAARAKADAVARAAGVALGEVLEVSEGGGGVPRPVFQPGLMRAAVQEAAPVSPGEVEVQATAQLTFAIR